MIRQSLKLKGNDDNSIFDSKWNCFLFPFLSLLFCYIFFILKKGKPDPNGYYLIHYLYNYDHGYVPRGLLGEVLSWFFDTISNELISDVSNLFSVLLVLASSALCGIALYKAKGDAFKQKVVLTVMFVVCIMPTTFSVYFETINLDKVLWLLSVVAVCLSGSSFGIWLVPVLCVIATMVNPMYLFGSMILVAIILLQKFYDSGWSLKNGLICFVSYVSMLLLGIYAPISEKKLGFNSPQEIVDFYFSRYSDTISENTYTGFLTEWLFDYFQPIDESIKSAFNLYFIGWNNGQKFFVYLIFVALPCYLLLSVIWINAIKNEKKYFQKFIYFLCFISPVVLIPPVIVSWELPRYFSDNFVTQLCLVAFFTLNRNSSVSDSVKKLMTFFKSNQFFLMVTVFYFIMLTVR